MTNTLAVIGVVSYILIGVRCGFVIRRAAAKFPPLDWTDDSVALLTAVLWPVLAFAYGLCVFLSGDTGLYGSAERRESRVERT